MAEVAGSPLSLDQLRGPRDDRRGGAHRRLNRRGGAARAGLAVVVLAAVAKFASSPGQSFFLAVFVDHIIADTGVTRTSFSALYAIATIVSATMVLQVGRAIDRWGTGAIWIAVSAGLAAACATLSMASGAAVVLLALCFMRGFGQGSFPLLGTVLVASSFDRARGRATAAATQGVTVAGVVLPGVGVALIAAFGWRTALALVALAVVVAILPLGWLAGRQGGRARASVQERPPREGVVATARRPGVARLLIILAAGPLVSTAVVVHAVSILGHAGLGPAEAAAAISLMALSTAGGALLGGVVADRFRPRAVLAALATAITASATLLLFATPLTGYLAFVCLGIAGGLYSTANGALWARAYGTANLGGLQGLAAGVQIAGAAGGPLPLALSLSIAGSYAPGLVLLALLGVTALVAGWRWSPAVCGGPAVAGLSGREPMPLREPA